MEYNLGMSENYHKDISQLFKLLSHPARLAILEVLREDEHCVCHLEARLGFRQAYISQQLALLREAGVVDDRRDGWNIYYRVVRPEVFELVDTARSALKLPAVRTRRLPIINACPCPKCGGQETRATG